MCAFNVGKNRAGTTTAGDIQIGRATISAAEVNLFTNAGVTQVDPIVFIGAAGDGTLNIAAVDTVDLRPGVATGAGHRLHQRRGPFHCLQRQQQPSTSARHHQRRRNRRREQQRHFGRRRRSDIERRQYLRLQPSACLRLAPISMRAARVRRSIGLLSNAGINQTAGGLRARTCSRSSATSWRQPRRHDARQRHQCDLRQCSLVNLTGGNISFTNSVGYTVGGIGSITYTSLPPVPSGRRTPQQHGRPWYPHLRHQRDGHADGRRQYHSGLGRRNIVSTRTLVVGAMSARFRTSH